MPSHSWPVVSRPVTASTSGFSVSAMMLVLGERHAGGLVEAGPVAGPECVERDREKEGDEVEEAAGLREAGQDLVGHRSLLTAGSAGPRRAGSPRACRASADRRRERRAPSPAWGR